MSGVRPAQVAAYGLADAPEGLAAGPLDDAAWAELVAAVQAERLTGHLLAAVSDGALPATDGQFDEAVDAHLGALGTVLRLEQLLLDVAGRLGAAGIDVRVLKGSAVAHHLYPDPALRTFADVDLLVPADHFDRAVDVIVAADGKRQFPQPRPGFDRRFAKGTSFSMPGFMEIDLHRTFVSGPFGLTVRLGDLFERPWTFRLAGVELAGLDPETGFLHLCYHAALGDATPRLVPLRDLAQALGADELDVDRVCSLAAAWRAEPAVVRALRAVWSTFELTTDHPLWEWARTRPPNPAAERALRSYTRPGNAYGGQAVDALRVIPGVGAKAAYLRALVFPDRSYLDGRYHGHRERWQRGLTTVRRLRRTP